jgi:hypothetical protein
VPDSPGRRVAPGTRLPACWLARELARRSRAPSYRADMTGFVVAGFVVAGLIVAGALVWPGALVCHRTVAGAAQWHIRRRGGPHDGACERPARGARLGVNRAPAQPPRAGEIHRSTNMCSNQDRFPCGTHVCSNNLHVSGKLWPLASIRCYSLVPSKRPNHPSGNGRSARDLPQPARRLGGTAPDHRARTAPAGRTVAVARHRRCAAARQPSRAAARDRRHAAATDRSRAMAEFLGCAAPEHRPGSAGGPSRR